METTKFCESVVEEAALSWFEGLDYAILNGPEIAPDQLFAERESYGEVILFRRLRDAAVILNPIIPTETIDEVIARIAVAYHPSLERNNQEFHRMLTDGVSVEYQAEDRIAHDYVKLIDFNNPDNNEFLVVNQYTVVEGEHNRRPDIVVFINGLPVAVIELKNPLDPNADVWSAFKQLQTYKAQIPSLFHFNAMLVVSDGMEARIGTLTASEEWFLPWRTIEGDDLAPLTSPQLEVLIKGVFEKSRLLQLIRHFIVFEEQPRGGLAKKVAGYHQFHAVRTAVEATIEASRPEGDRRCGVVWHTQGSGKSLTMVFYAGRIILHPEMENPTIVVITDRNDLDDQLYGTFCRCRDLLRQDPVQAESRQHLRELLKVSSGGVVFTTVQKFMPVVKGDSAPTLSERRNIVVIADEAHRSQYDFIDGFARHMRDALPNASFIGFTGTPIELRDKNTRAVFGDYISIYDIQRAVEDKATVPIYYSSRVAKLELSQEERPHLDEDFDEVTEGEEVEKKEKLKTKWAALEAVAGAEKRVELIAEDIVKNFEERLDSMDGKAMVVCMSRRICVSLYDALIKLRPEWHDDSDDKGFIKVVMTGSASDPPEWQQHIRNKQRREKLADRFRDAGDPFKMVLVRDMWLTGFDVPSLHTMYVDKPMRGHGLMQAIARVNRVFKDKPGGLVVDYLGIADQLRSAMRDYTESGGKGETAFDQAEAVAVMKEKYEVCLGLFHGFDWTAWRTGTAAEKMSLLPQAQEFILAQEDGKERLLQAVTELSSAFALSVPHEEALRIRDDVGFFQAVRAVLAKTSATKKRTEEQIDHAIQQIVDKAIAPDGVIDIFEAAGLPKPDISILSEEFLEDVRKMPQRNLAVELLRKLLNDEIKVRSRRNLVQSRSFAELLEKSIRAYQNRVIEAAQVIEELIELARQMREASKRGEDLGLGEDELAFYDALETNDSAVAILGDDVLKKIAQELVDTVRKNVTIDWTVRENVRAKMRVMIKRILRKYNYPPDKQEKATQTVIEQAELICGDLMKN